MFVHLDHCRCGAAGQEADGWEVPFGALRLGATLGEGAFGTVLEATLDSALLPVPPAARVDEEATETRQHPAKIAVAVKLLHGKYQNLQRWAWGMVQKMPHQVSTNEIVHCVDFERGLFCSLNFGTKSFTSSQRQNVEIYLVHGCTEETDSVLVN